MVHFRKLSDEQLQELSKAFGNHPLENRPAWSVEDLKQERNMDCISRNLYEKINSIKGFTKEDLYSMGKLFGYEETESGIQMFLTDYDAVDSKFELEKEPN